MLWRDLCLSFLQPHTTTSPFSLPRKTTTTIHWDANAQRLRARGSSGARWQAPPGRRQPKSNNHHRKSSKSNSTKFQNNPFHTSCKKKAAPTNVKSTPYHFPIPSENIPHNQSILTHQTNGQTTRSDHQPDPQRSTTEKIQNNHPFQPAKQKTQWHTPVCREGVPVSIRDQLDLGVGWGWIDPRQPASVPWPRSRPLAPRPSPGRARAVRWLMEEPGSAAQPAERLSGMVTGRASAQPQECVISIIM